jgi:imidazole glycerol-phosphate synthase subunit HisH
MLTIVDYGVGNLASIRNMLKKIGVNSLITSCEKELLAASQLILPGVGAFDTCVAKLEESGLLPALNKKVLVDKIPVLGICVGMQLILEGSAEGRLSGLGWIKGKNVRFKQEHFPPGFKVPHMGWIEVTPAKDSRLFYKMPQEPRFYFVHSYYAELTSPKDALCYAEYGYSFVAGIEHENIMAVQFHPEKSHKYGMKLLENFTTLI